MHGVRRLLTLAAMALVTAPVLAQQYAAEKPLGVAAQSTPPYLQHAGIDQNLNHLLPLSDRFTDENGKDAALGSYFRQRPVMMALVYFKCGMLCPQVLHGMATALRQSGFHAGNEYDVIVSSIDPTDSASDAIAAKQHFLAMLDAPQGSGAVHFLTGGQQSITDLANATGFHYVRVPGPDGKMDQFAHSSVIMIATPDGRMSKYLSGIEYQPRDIRLALIQASNHRIGSLSDMILLYCCSYVPSQGRYTVAVLRILGIAAMFTLLAMAIGFYLLTKKPKLAVSPQLRS